MTANHLFALLDMSLINNIFDGGGNMQQTVERERRLCPHRLVGAHAARALGWARAPPFRMRHAACGVFMTP